jgi:hypothetical protein
MAHVTKARVATLALAAVALGAGLVLSRALAHPRRVEHALPPSPAAVEHLRPEVVDADFTPPHPREVRAALRHAFGLAVQPLRGDGLVGDFNGDGAPDLAVEVRPAAGHLAEVNDDVANWTIQDCASAPAWARPRGHPRARPVVADDEALVAILHGYGPRGWRDPEARQVYLLKNGGHPAGAQPRRAYPGLDAPGTETGGHVLTSASPVPGVVYWTGARYAWRDASAAGTGPGVAQ